MKEKPTGRESHFLAAAQDPQDVAIPPPPTEPPYKSVMLRGKTETGP